LYIINSDYLYIINTDSLCNCYLTSSHSVLLFSSCNILLNIYIIYRIFIFRLYVFILNIQFIHLVFVSVQSAALWFPAHLWHVSFCAQFFAIWWYPQYLKHFLTLMRLNTRDFFHLTFNFLFLKIEACVSSSVSIITESSSFLGFLWLLIFSFSLAIFSPAAFGISYLLHQFYFLTVAIKALSIIFSSFTSI